MREILESQGRYEEYVSLHVSEKTSFLLDGDTKNFNATSDIAVETLRCMKIIKTIQKFNGEEGCNRYIISNCSGETDVIELLALFQYAGWDLDELTVDIVPLFETVSDLDNSALAMTQLYRNRRYFKHVKERKKKQTIMLGFSDGTKDGGYFTANWSIYRAKESLTAAAREYDMEVIFFDGRGGPAARGGGKTHNFYASHGRSIENRRVHLTVQGQTISSNFGTAMSAQYNMEQLVSAGIKNSLYEQYNKDFIPEDRVLMEKLSRRHDAYTKLRDHEKFTDYMVERTAMPYYGQANIGSRPDKRKGQDKFQLKDLRAIPFVASWTLNKQNIPGFYGLGYALTKTLAEDSDGAIEGLYRRSLFFRTLVENSMMVLKKTNFNVTRYIKQDDEYSDLWNMLHDEFNTTTDTLLKISGARHLMAGNPKDRLSVELRERIVLPLCVIQQYALCRLFKLKGNEKKNAELIEKYTRMIIRSSYGIINAGRNSA